MKKLFFLVFITVLSIGLFAMVTYDDLGQNIAFKANNETVDNDLLTARSQSLVILQSLKLNFSDFYDTLTKTATGIELLNEYSEYVRDKLINEVLFIQFVESKGIDLQRTSTKDYFKQNIEKIFKDSSFTQEDIDMYLFTKGYLNIASYINEKFYSALYKNAILKLHEKITLSYSFTDSEMKKEYDTNKKNYMSRPYATIKLLYFDKNDEAKQYYQKIIDGIYTFDEIYALLLKTSYAQETTVYLDEESELSKVLKTRAPGSIVEPSAVQEKTVIIRIEKKAISKQLTFDEAKDNILINLRDMKAKDYFDKILPQEFESFKNNASVVINSKNF